MIANDGLDSLVLNAISKCWREDIDLPTLLAILRGEREPIGWDSHMALFFTELPLEAAVRFILAHHLQGPSLRACYDTHLLQGGDPHPDLEDWLDG